MRRRISLTVTEELLRAVDWHRRKIGESRSRFIEAALSDYVKHLDRNELDARELELINRRADFLNREAVDVLDYQVTNGMRLSAG